MTTTDSRKIVVESAEAVLGLHWFVARDFTVKDKGIEIEIVTPGIRTRFDWSDPRSRDHHLVTPTNYQKAFEEGRADIYRACEWGQIRRSYDNPEGPIVARRPAMVYQGVYVRPDSPIEAPISLANRSVGVQFHQGSHYATLSMLEGFVSREQINVVPRRHRAGALREPDGRRDRRGDPDGTLGDPGREAGLQAPRRHLLPGYRECVAEHEPGPVRGPDAERCGTRLASSTRTSGDTSTTCWTRSPRTYSSQISPADFHLPYLRYVDPVPYTEEEFERAYNWMLTWDLVGENAEFGTLVSNRI